MSRIFRIFSRREALLFLLFLVCYSYFYYPGGWNENSRYDLIYSIVNEGKLYIDSYHENTQDKSFYDGHYYSDKAPGSSFLGSVVYLIIRPFVANPALAEYLIRFFIVSLPSAFLCVLIYRFSGQFTRKEKYRLMASIAYGLGTMAFPYSILFFGHQISSAILFSGFYVISGKKENLDAKAMLMSGMLFGLAFITEYTTIIISILASFYAFYFLKNKKGILLLIAGFIPPLVLLFAYNYICFGSPVAVGYSLLSYPESSAFQSQGFFGIAAPGLQSIYGILLSPYRGLFFFSPFLLLSIPGFYYFHKNKKLKGEFMLFLLSALAFIAWNSGYAVWWGGWALGPRHLVPALPFMILPAIFCLERWGNWRRYVAYVLLAISIFMISAATVTDPNLPEKKYNPFFEHTLPLISKGETGFNLGNLVGLQGTFSLIPLFAVLIAICFLLLNGMRMIYGKNKTHSLGFAGILSRKRHPHTNEISPHTLG